MPLEVSKSVKHDKRGLMSMARYDDPNSGTSSFSITLGPAPHLDMLYTIFGYDPGQIEYAACRPSSSGCGGCQAQGLAGVMQR